MNFEAGQRALFQDMPAARLSNRFRAVSLGLDNFVMHLNAKDEDGKAMLISGRILEVNVYGNPDSFIFRPDGWPLPEELGRGVILSGRELRHYAEESPILPGRVTDNLGRALSKEEIQLLIEKRLSKSKGVST